MRTKRRYSVVRPPRWKRDAVVDRLEQLAAELESYSALFEKWRQEVRGSADGS